MSDKAPSKSDQIRALREARAARSKKPEGRKPKPHMDTPSEVPGKRTGAKDMPSPETSGPSESNPKKKRAPKGTFDRKAYQRELMRRRRAKE